MTDRKQAILNALDVMRRADLAGIADAEKKKTAAFKARAYKTVIEQIRAFEVPITSYDQVKNIKGAGEKIKLKLKEIIETGELEAATRAKERTSLDVLDVLTAIHGVGPVKARSLLNSGIQSIQQLREEVAKNPDLLNDVQQMGLKYYEDSLERIPRGEMEMHEKRILGEVDSRFEAVVVGSYRRGAASSGDIDVLMTLPESMPEKEQKQAFAKEIQRLTDANYIVDTLAEGPKKFMGYVRLSSSHKARRLDLLMTPEKEFAYAILYFTGSQEFNVGFRRFCLDKGYTINEHIMKPTREGVAEVPRMKTEKDIFDFLNLQYVKPEDRKAASDVKEKVATVATESKEENRSRSNSRSPNNRNGTKKKKKKVLKVVASEYNSVPKNNQ
jgi:DNA polymerase beta